MFIRCLSFVALCGLGCQGKAKETPTPTPAPAPIVVRDGKGAVIAQVQPGHPCRATIDRIELFVGGPPLVSQHGEEHWTGVEATNGTTLLRDGARVVRLFPTRGASELAVIDPTGTPLVRIVAGKDAANVTAPSGSLIRQLSRTGDAIAARDGANQRTLGSGEDPPEFTISGTTDLVLAAVLSAPELVPDVRGMAACERVLAGSHEGST